MSRALLVVALLVGAALRLYPLHRDYIHPDQELLPMQALAMLVAGNWRPRQLTYPSGFVYLLRESYAVVLWWSASVRHAVADAADLFARYLAAPFGFHLVARAWSCAFGIATIPLTARLATTVAGPRAGGVAALVVATSFLHVRESHYGSVDAAATACFVATLVATTAIVATRETWPLVVAGVLAGLTAAFRYQLGVVAVGIPVAVWLRREPGSTWARVMAVAGGALAALGAFAVTTPYSLLEAGRAWAEVALQLRSSYAGFATNLSVADALAVAVGLPACLLAAAGVVLAFRDRRATTLVLLVVAVPYAYALWRSTRPFARYVLPLVPLLAVFAAAAIVRVADLVPRRWRNLALVLLAVVVVAEPLGRALALDRLLAQDDTRTLAAEWLAANARDGDRLWLPAVLPHANPALPLDTGFVAFRCGPDVARAIAPYVHDAARLTRRVYSPRELESLRRSGGLVVTAEHPALGTWARVPPELNDFLLTRAQRVAEFPGLDPARAGETRFEWIDANFVPLGGLCALEHPGPTLRIWRVYPLS